MATAYTPGLTVTNRITHRCRRVLPIPGDVLVGVGDTVNARDVVAQTLMPGDITPMNIANMLALPPADVPECMLKSKGDRLEIGEPLARTKGIFGLFKKACKSKVAGTVESISRVTGQVMIRGEPEPVQVQAYVTGNVIEVIANEGCVIEAEVSFVQGIFGIGGEVYGRIVAACSSHDQELTADLIKPEMKDCIIIGGARMTDQAIRRARDVGAAAVVSGGIDDEDLRDFLGYDLGVAITGSEDLGLTIIVTEGFGEIAMAERTFELLGSRAGADASVNGATQIRAGVMRPEILIPLTEESRAKAPAKGRHDGQLTRGRPVRIIRDPFFGLIGTVGELPPEPQVLGSGSRARVLEVKLDSGDSVVIPRANVELIEG
ncbi:MAG: hypothetical protein O7F17_03855 [Planctomycetota bacterium]|nr:hypothetical protein [Planctomycetota bacterium]